MWVASAGALWLADLAGWSTAYAAMALLVLVGVSPCCSTRSRPRRSTGTHCRRSRPSTRRPPPARACCCCWPSLLGAFTGLLLGAGFGARAGWVGGVAVVAVLGRACRPCSAHSPAFRQAVIEPFRDFFVRNGRHASRW